MDIYDEIAITKIWKILGIENYEQAKGKSVDILVADLKQQRDDLLEACKGMVSNSEMLQEDEGITACQCMVKAHDIDEPTQCNYCKAIAAIANCE